jgi:hypothetical protein
MESLISILTKKQKLGEDNEVSRKAILTKKYSNSYYLVEKFHKPILRF